MTVATLRKMGNSLGFTLPAAEVKRLGLHAGDAVEIEITPAKTWAQMAGALRGRLGNVDDLLREMDADDTEAEARKWQQLEPKTRPRRGK